MRIDIKKLQAMGVGFSHSEDEQTLDFYSEEFNKVAHEKVKNLAHLLEFTDSETDQLISAVYRIQMFSVLRRASGG